MSNDIFAAVPGSSRSSLGDSFVGGPLSRARTLGDSYTLVPTDPETQRLMDVINAEKEIERSRKEREMDTPENRQKAAEAEAAERNRKRIDFHFKRAIPRCLEEGWKHVRQELTNEEIRVYTTDWKRRRFWGIKPAGVGMLEFWEVNDPEITRFYDNVAVTWEDPLVPPPVTAFDENMPVIWAGRGVNPDLTPPEPLVPEAPPATKVAKTRRRQKTPEPNSTQRVRKSKAPSRKTNKKGARKSLADETDAGPSRLEDQIPEAPSATPATNGPSQNENILPPPTLQYEPAPKDQDQRPTHSNRPRRHPAHTADPTSATSAPPPPKRTRGRPPKAHPATKTQDASTPQRPRGRPPGKGKSTPAVQGNARVTKSSSTSQTKPKGQRALAPSTHVMRTRGKGAAESLRLP